MTNNTKQQYFEAVKKLLLKNKVHSIDELQQLATDTGMGKESWNALQKELQDSLTRGKGFMKYKNWEDAIQEFKHAEKINPFHLGTLMELAEAHKQLWLQNSSPVDEELAEQYAKRCLQVQPTHEHSLQLISSLKNSDKEIPQTNNPLWWRKWLALLAILLVVGNVLMYQMSENKPIKTIDKPITDNESTTTNTRDKVDYGNLKVDIRYEGMDQSLKWLIEDSYLQEFESSFGYTLKMNILPRGVEVNRLRIKVTLFDENRQVVYSQDKRVVSDESYIPGDFIPVVMTLYKEVESMPKIESAEISVIDSKINALFKMKPTSPKKTLSWGVNKPPGVEFEVRERGSKLSSSYNKKSTYHHLVLEVTNKGKYPVKGLKMGVSWVNKDPKIVQSDTIYVVSSVSTTILKPAQRFVVDRTYEIKGYTPEMLQSIAFSVLELEY